MDAMGKDIILLETVGVGQDEVEMVHTALTPPSLSWSPGWEMTYRPSRLRS